MIDHSTFHNVRGPLYVEPPSPHGLRRRVFRAVGNAWEYAYLSDIQETGQRARFYGYAPAELPDSITDKNCFPMNPVINEGDTVTEPGGRCFSGYHNREIDQPQRNGLVVVRVWFADFEHAPHWRLEAYDPQSSYRVSGNINHFRLTT